MTEKRECRFCQHWEPVGYVCRRLTDGSGKVWIEHAGKDYSAGMLICTRPEFSCVLFAPRERAYTEIRMEAERKRALGVMDRDDWITDADMQAPPIGIKRSTFWPSIEEQTRKNREVNRQVEELTGLARKKERLAVATAALQGMLARTFTQDHGPSVLAETALMYADALLKKLEEPDAKS